MPLDEAESILADIIRRFQKEREEDKAENQRLRDDIVSIVENLRKDIFASLAPVQLNQIEHDKIHEYDRKERYMKQEENARRFDDLHRDIQEVRFVLVIGLLLFLGGLLAVAVLK